MVHCVVTCDFSVFVLILVCVINVWCVQRRAARECGTSVPRRVSVATVKLSGWLVEVASGVARVAPAPLPPLSSSFVMVRPVTPSSG